MSSQTSAIVSSEASIAGFCPREKGKQYFNYSTDLTAKSKEAFLHTLSLFADILESGFSAT